MTKPETMTSFIRRSSMPEALIRAVVKQIGGWAEFQEHAKDVTEHGADGGFGGFIYYSDTCAFYARNQEEIVTYAEELGQDIGAGGALNLVMGFRCLQESSTQEEVGRTLYGNKSRHDTQVANALAWFALEEVARSYEER